MVAGIIVVAAADEVVLSDPRARATAAAAWVLLGGYALYLAGHAAFKAVVSADGLLVAVSRPWRCWPCSGCWRRAWPC